MNRKHLINLINIKAPTIKKYTYVSKINDNSDRV